MSQIEKPKEVAVLEKKLTKELTIASELVVSNEDELLQAGEVRRGIKDLAKQVKEEKEKATKPLNEVLKTIRSWFAPMEEAHEEAIEVIESKIKKYNNQQEMKRLQAEKEAAEKIKEAQKKERQGKISETQLDAIVEKAEAKVEKYEPVKRTETFHTRKIKNFRVVDEKLIPRKYLILDTAAVRKEMYAGVPITGIEYYEEETLV